MATGIITILDWFKTGSKPTQAQFWATWQSFWHKDELIPQNSIDGLIKTLNAKAEKEQFSSHLIDKEAHLELFNRKADKNELILSTVFTGPDLEFKNNLGETVFSVAFDISNIRGLQGALSENVYKKEDLQLIDRLIQGDKYAVTEDDFGKTLVYTGSTNIHIILSSSIYYEEGDNFHILQLGAGGVTFETDGFLLTHADDETPKLFGQHSMAKVLLFGESLVKNNDERFPIEFGQRSVINEKSPEAFIYGKLAIK